MELTLKTMIWLAAILLTGLSAGFFYAWEVSVIQGTKQISDRAYVEAMQQINRAIINPAFMVIFIGPLIIQTIATFQHRGSAVFVFLLGALLIYLCGTFLVTVLGNVPLNNALDLLDINSLRDEALKKERLQYEIKWNRLHTIRTVFSVLAFIALIIPILMRNQ